MARLLAKPANKQTLAVALIRQRGAVNTFSLLIMFLLSISCFTFGSLYFESSHKNKLLSAEVDKLKDSQVLLMVPDEQAEVMANWMANNPDFVQSFIEKARQGETTLLPIGPGVEQPVSHIGNSQQASIEQAVDQKAAKTLNKSKTMEQDYAQETERSAAIKPLEVKPSQEKAGVSNKASNALQAKTQSTEPVTKAVTLTETDDGVKMIRLPHGGVLITTREPSE
ncbi:hypothetical protein AB4298_17750 [Shewanella sp. 10N.261.52.F9]|uniref:hypothetical protein n=1 Tax=Shewanella sp. 10N.261.52.F9 TaxID=3229684 RepID=UPI0035522837